MQKVTQSRQNFTIKNFVTKTFVCGPEQRRPLRRQWGRWQILSRWIFIRYCV